MQSFDRAGTRKKTNLSYSRNSRLSEGDSATQDYNYAQQSETNNGEQSSDHTLNRMESLKARSMNMGQKLDEDKIKRLEQIKKFKNEKNLASYKPAQLPKAVVSPPRKGAMSSVGGGYGVKPPIAKDVPAKLNQSGILDKKKTNKDSSAAEETLSGMVKAFPMVRNKPGSVVGGLKLAG